MHSTSLPAFVSKNKKRRKKGLIDVFSFLLLPQDGLVVLCCQQLIGSELPGPQVCNKTHYFMFIV